MSVFAPQEVHSLNYLQEYDIYRFPNLADLALPVKHSHRVFHVIQRGQPFLEENQLNSVLSFGIRNLSVTIVS